MEVVDAKQKVLNDRYELMELYGMKVLFSDGRIARDTLPKGIYRYEIRHSDEGFEMCELAKGIMVNHYGTILSNKEIPLDRDGYRDIDEMQDVNYLGESKTLKQYMKESKMKKKEQER